MDGLEVFSLLVLPDGLADELVLLRLVWVLSATMLHMAGSGRMLRRFLDESPVVVQLLPYLEQKCALAGFRSSIWS